MTPEISHRCPSCGVAVRERDAMFCPECGRALTDKSEATQTAQSTKSPDAAAQSQDNQSPAAVTEPPKNDESPLPQPAVANGANAEDSRSTASAEVDSDAHPAHRRGEKTRERLHRASEVARGVTRGVIEEPAKRVEKIRHASNVVIEEASYDPSLRFVLVALGLFLVFIALLIVSKVMG